MGWAVELETKPFGEAFRLLLVGLLAFALCSSPAAANVAASTLTTIHRVELESVGIPLRSPGAGQPGAAEVNQWIPVPDWLGGTWQAKTELVLSSYSFQQQRSTINRTVKIPILRQTVIGCQRDKRGRLWHYVGTPYRRSITTSSYVEYQLIDKVTLLKSSPAEVSVNCQATVTRVDKASNELLDNFKKETVTTYKPLKDGLIEVTFVTGDYDIQGNPLFASKEMCTETRIKPFRTFDGDDRGDLRRRFRLFLINNNMRELLPEP